MKILLSGSSGFFSKEFIKYISDKNKINLICVSRKKRKIDHVKLWNLDLSKNNLKKIPKKNHFDLVIHTSFIKMNNNKNKEILKKNINITKNFITLLKENNFKKVINLSSASLYPNIDGKFSEKSEINFFHNNDSVYGYSKYLAENLFDTYIDEKKIIHLRVGNIIGNDSDSSIISEMKKSLRQRNLIEIYGDGKRVINLVHIKSLIKYILLFSKKKSSGVFNVSDYSIDLKQIANLIKIKYGKSNSKIKFKRLLKKNPKFYLKTNKFFNFFNIQKPNNKELFNEI